MFHSYQKLGIWQKAIDLTVVVYDLVKKLPKEETYALSDQMRRAVVSIASNIAEGQERNSTADFIRFLNIAMGSKAELETQIIIGNRIGYFSNDDIAQPMQMTNEISKMTRGLISKLKTNPLKTEN